MSSEQRVAIAEKNLDRLLAWIATIDTKIGFVFAVDMAMLGVLAALAPATPGAWGTGQAISSFSASAFLLLSVGITLLAIRPRLDEPTKHSLIYFGCITKLDSEKYQQAMSDLSFGGYLKDLVAQCHRNAEIADDKYKTLRNSVIATIGAILPWLFAVYTLYNKHD